MLRIPQGPEHREGEDRVGPGGEGTGCAIPGGEEGRFAPLGEGSGEGHEDRRAGDGPAGGGEMGEVTIMKGIVFRDDA
jgi:hypothetical protein